MAVLEAFVYDPLIAWRLNATDKRPGGVPEGDDMEEGAYVKQRKSKANETEILIGMCPSRSSCLSLSSFLFRCLWSSNLNGEN